MAENNINRKAFILRMSKKSLKKQKQNKDGGSNLQYGGESPVSSTVLKKDIILLINNLLKVMR